MAGIDFEGIDLIVNLLEKWKKRANFVVISHIWEPLIDFADYIIILNAGRVYFSGEAEIRVDIIKNLFRRPKKHKTSRFT